MDITSITPVVIHLGWLSLVPALVAIVLALVTKRLIEPLLAGIAVAAFFIDSHGNGLGHAFKYIIPNMFSSISGHATNLVDKVEGFGIAKDPSRGEFIISLLLLGAFVRVLDKSGGALHFAEEASKRIKTEVGALLAAMVIGLCLFTSAYFSILVAGTMMLPIFDRMKISREKLALYCDCMAVPTKTLIPISGWIAFMSILIEDNIPGVGKGNGIHGFIQTIPYNFYCWGIIFIILLLSFKIIPNFGPLKEAEERVKKLGLIHKEGAKPMMDNDDVENTNRAGGKMIDMFLPLLVSVVSLLTIGMWDTYYAKWFDLAPLKVNSMQILNISFFLGIFSALILYCVQKLMSVGEFLDTAMEGSKSTVIGCMSVILAMTLGDMMKASAPEGLGTAPFIIEILKPYLVASWLPAITFLISCGMSFATGTSWGVWGIMMPISIPLALSVGMDPFVIAAAVLSGGAFGDHCSPISDTAVLSSIASNSDHNQHVRTQMPYAVLSAVLALAGYVILGFTLI